jgi:hypothetical protein
VWTHIEHFAIDGAPSLDLVSSISLFKKNYCSNKAC